MKTSLAKTSVTTVKGVGAALATKLKRLGIESLQDALFHLPFRYEDRTRISPIGGLRPGDTAVLEGEIVACDVAYGRRRSLLAFLQDNTGRIGLRFYHFSKAQQNNLQSSKRIRCYGEVRRGAAGLEIYHPEYTNNLDEALADTLTPVYPTTEGLGQPRIRALVEQVLKNMNDGEAIPELLGNRADININQAISYVHSPPADADVSALMDMSHPMQQRLAFEELLAQQVSFRFMREYISSFESPPLPAPREQYVQLIDSFGFKLTGAQQRVADEVKEDLMSSTPTLRLIQGDVGSGKTVIAALAATHASESGYQVALMAPTEILAEQHFINITGWLANLGINTAWLSGKVKGKRRQQELANIANGAASVVVGTHALFQQDVVFSKLGLVIVDEQHRFGVHQRMALKEKGADGKVMPHQLVMTATPIPRTLTMSLYADMDHSIIDELPPGRTPVQTSVLQDSRRADVIERVASACKGGAQAYWVCTLIEESEVLQCEAAEDTAKILQQELSGLEVGLIHGRMSSNDKVGIMQQFSEGNIDLLVATTVIEVGVDVPNASLMVIENSERLGLTQLHQLRGRVGRGKRESYCLLLYRPPLGELGKKRLNVMRESTDGFFIAEQDLQIRGPGDLLGARQSGLLNYRIADLQRDAHMLPDVKKLAGELMQADREAAQALVERWLNSPDEYGQV